MNGLDLLRSPGDDGGRDRRHRLGTMPARCPRELRRPLMPGVLACVADYRRTAKRKGPSDKQTAPGRDSAPYYPPTEAIRKAAERLKDGNMEYTAIALIRAHDGEELPQP